MIKTTKISHTVPCAVFTYQFVCEICVYIIDLHEHIVKYSIFPMLGYIMGYINYKKSNYCNFVQKNQKTRKGGMKKEKFLIQKRKNMACFPKIKNVSRNRQVCVVHL